MCKIEATNEPAYAYVGFKKDKTVWVRSAKFMEDGRFKLTYRPKEYRPDLDERDYKSTDMLTCTECSSTFTYDLACDPPAQCENCGGEWAQFKPLKKRKKGKK